MLITGQLAVSLANAQLHERLERRTQERTQQLRQAHTQLLASARMAGTTLRTSRLADLAQAVRLMGEHAHDLDDFITRDADGRLLPGRLHELAQALEREHQDMASVLGTIEQGTDLIGDAVTPRKTSGGISGPVAR
jgi:hypothetical protein